MPDDWSLMSNAGNTLECAVEWCLDPQGALEFEEPSRTTCDSFHRWEYPEEHVFAVTKVRRPFWMKNWKGSAGSVEACLRSKGRRKAHGNGRTAKTARQINKHTTASVLETLAVEWLVYSDEAAFQPFPEMILNQGIQSMKEPKFLRPGIEQPSFKNTSEGFPASE